MSSDKMVCDVVKHVKVGEGARYIAFGQIFSFVQYSNEEQNSRFLNLSGTSGLILPQDCKFPRKKKNRFESDLDVEMEEKSSFSSKSKQDSDESALEKEIRIDLSEQKRNHILEDLLNTSFAREEESDIHTVIKKHASRAPEEPTSFYKRPHDPGFIELHEDLLRMHPAMSQVIEFLVDELALSVAQTKPSPRPILLVGPPGSGKTYFASDLAIHLNAPFFSLSIATADTPWPLTGTNSTWRTAKPSDLIQKIAASNAMAGVIFIDEVTSVKNDSERNHPILPALLELLDLEQSSRFKDHFFNYEMDLSGWVKILACNDLSGLAPAILDRCEVIQITRPTPEVQLQIIRNMASKLPARFSDESLVALNKSSRSLRQIGADLRRLAARSIREGGQVVQEIHVRRMVISQTQVLQHLDFYFDKKKPH